MRVLFGTNITNDKNNQEMDGEERIVASIPPDIEQTLDESVNDLEAQEERAKLPFPLRIGLWVFGIGALTCVLLIVESAVKASLKQTYADMPWLFYVGGIALIVTVVLGLLQYARLRKLTESSSYQGSLRQVDQLADKAYAALGVPGDALEIDVLMTDYVIQEGEVVPAAADKDLKGMMIPAQTKAFVQEGTLFLADTHDKWAIPLEGITGIRKVKQPVWLAGWNKDIPCNKGPYKDYRMSVDDGGDVHLKAYYALMFTIDGEDYTLYFPPYEGPAIHQLTGWNIPV